VSVEGVILARITLTEEGAIVADIDKLVKMCRRGAVKMRPVLPLGQAMSLGMVGYLDNHAFRYVGTVETMLGGTAGKALPGEGLPSAELVSGKEVSLLARIKGETSETFGDIAKAKARIETTFGSGKSFLLTAPSVEIATMEEPVGLLAAMLRAYNAGLWKEEYCFVYQTGRPSSYRAALAHQSGAKLLLSVSGAVGQGPVSVGSLAAKARFEGQSGALEQLITNRPVTAFFNAYRVKDRFFRGPTVQVASKLSPNLPRDDIRAALKVSGNPFEQV
jgi:hypothetical protein